MSSNDTVPLDAFGQPFTSDYAYVPTRYVCQLFVILFAVSTLLHFGQAIRYRTWWLLPTVVLAGVGEVTGWAGRYWSSYSPLNDTPYLMQIVCLIIAPTPLVGAIFISFGQLTTRVGQHYSRLSTRLYSRIFLTCDITSLFIQSVGGGMAASSHATSTQNLGSNIMLAGIIFQLVSLTVFSALMAEYLFCYARNTPVRRIPVSTSADTVFDYHPSGAHTLSREMRLLAIGLAFESLLLIIRAVYRTIELADGFNGKIIETEIWFNVFDGAMVVTAMCIMNALHPVRLWRAHDKRIAQLPFAMKSSSAGVREESEREVRVPLTM